MSATELAAIVLTPATCHESRQAVIQHPNQPGVTLCALCSQAYYFRRAGDRK